MKNLLQIFFFFLLLIPVGYAQWERQNPVPAVNGFLCVKFISESTGFAAGDEAMMLKTTEWRSFMGNNRFRLLLLFN